MTQAWVSIALVILFLSLLPLGLKWFQRRYGPLGGTAQSSSQIISSLALGPQQRVITIEVGPQGQRTWLTLGVTTQSITCLHSAPAPLPALAPIVCAENATH
jgi:flagellar protein FliO/FliZ